MPPRLSNPPRVLLFGNDAELLETRAQVLRHVGMVAEIALRLDALIDVRPPYDGVVCCYSATEAECKQLAAMTNQNGTPLLRLEPPLSPLELVRQVSGLIRQGRPGLTGA